MADQTFEVELRIDLNAPDLRGELSRALGDVNTQVTGFDKNIAGVQKSLDGTGQSAQKTTQSLSNTRYALYDVSTTLAGVGVVLGGLAIATAGVAIAWERDFAQVVRTTGVTGDEVGKLRGELVDLAQTMPVAFGDLAQIATLAGQLGVAEDRVASFTETVAKFSAVTDLTVDAAATSFGRLDALLPGVQGNYEALGSAIALVGVNSVATESQITAISTQISAMANLAGLTAGEVVGLAGALASVGAAPELSRGTITRVFSQMQKAIAGGGDQLEKFAQIAGVSGDEFASAFGTARFGPIFESFIRGLSSVENANIALQQLGITSVRDVPLLLRLAEANDLVSQSFADGRKGFDESSELNRQYGIIAETTAAKLQILVNNFNALLAAVGSGTTGPLKAVIDWASDFLGRITDIVSNPFGQWVTGIMLGLTALVGVLALVAGAAAAGFAGIIAMQQALAGLTGASAVAGVGLKGLQAQLAATGASGMLASRAIGFVATAMKGLGIATAALVAIELGRIFSDWGDQLRGVDTTLDGLISTFESTNRLDVGFFGGSEGGGRAALEGFKNIEEGVLRAARAFDDLTGRAPEAYRRLFDLDDAMAQLAQGGNVEEVEKRIKQLGLASDDVAKLLPNTSAALREAKEAAEAAGDPMAELAAAEDQAAIEAEQFAATLGLTVEGLAAMESALASGSGKFFDFAQAAKDAYSDSGNGITEFMQKLEEQLAAQAAWAENVSILTARGATNFVTKLAEMGPEGAKLAADAVNLTSEELAKLEANTAQSIQLSSEAWARTMSENTPLLAAAYKYAGDEGVRAMSEALGKGNEAVTAELIKMRDTAKSLPVEVFANDSNALATLNALQRQINSATGTVTIYAQYSSGALQAIRDPGSYVAGRNFATGGSILGPGTGTSDSIPIWASNGEYMVKAAAVKKYGVGFMNALNSMRMPKFASGGPIGSSSSAPMAGLSGVVELGPQTMSKLSRDVTNNIMLGDVELSRAVESGNKKRKSMGEI